VKSSTMKIRAEAIIRVANREHAERIAGKSFPAIRVVQKLYPMAQHCRSTIALHEKDVVEMMSTNKRGWWNED
jgi:hypothetical protein